MRTNIGEMLKFFAVGTVVLILFLLGVNYIEFIYPIVMGWINDYVTWKSFMILVVIIADFIIFGITAIGFIPSLIEESTGILRREKKKYGKAKEVYATYLKYNNLEKYIKVIDLIFTDSNKTLFKQLRSDLTSQVYPYTKNKYVNKNGGLLYLKLNEFFSDVRVINFFDELTKASDEELNEFGRLHQLRNLSEDVIFVDRTNYFKWVGNIERVKEATMKETQIFGKLKGVN